MGENNLIIRTWFHQYKEVLPDLNIVSPDQIRNIEGGPMLVHYGKQVKESWHCVAPADVYIKGSLGRYIKKEVFYVYSVRWICACNVTRFWTGHICRYWMDTTAMSINYPSHRNAFLITQILCQSLALHTSHLT